MATKYEPQLLTNDGGKTFRTAQTAAQEARLRFNGYRSAPAAQKSASEAPKPNAPKN